jgi:hypothetical protein
MNSVVGGDAQKGCPFIGSSFGLKREVADDSKYRSPQLIRREVYSKGTPDARLDTLPALVDDRARQQGYHYGYAVLRLSFRIHSGSMTLRTGTTTLGTTTKPCQRGLWLCFPQFIRDPANSTEPLAGILCRYIKNTQGISLCICG